MRSDGPRPVAVSTFPFAGIVWYEGEPVPEGGFWFHFDAGPVRGRLQLLGVRVDADAIRSSHLNYLLRAEATGKLYELRGHFGYPNAQLVEVPPEGPAEGSWKWSEEGKIQVRAALRKAGKKMSR